MSRKTKIWKLIPLFEDLFGKTEEIFLLFADLCGSTEFKKKCADTDQPELVWISRQLVFLQRAAEIIQKYDGKIVKTIGDEVFAYFSSSTNPEQILKCAIEIIQSFDNLQSFKGKSKINAKISVDFGPTYNGSITGSIPFDPIGLPVDRCARLNSEAKQNEIVFSKDFLANLNSHNQGIINYQDRYGYKQDSIELKGLGKIDIYKILAQ